MSARTFSAVVPADAASLRSLRAFFGSVLEAQGCGDCERLVLALDEACANLVRHRAKAIDDGALRVALEVEPGLLRFRIACFCRAQDLDRIKPRAAQDRQPGGRGTAFIAQIMDRVSYAPERAGGAALELILEKRRDVGGAACGDADGPRD